MDTMTLAFVASTLALVVLPLFDYVVDEDTVIKRKMTALHARLPGSSASGPVPVHYARAA